MDKNKKYWEFKAKDNTNTEADLYLYLEIASWGGGYSAHSAKSFKNELDALGDIKTLNVYVNCPGGDVFEGNSIYNMLKRKSKVCDVNMIVDGIAASIGSVILMSGTHISLASNAMIMIHRASAYIYGNSDELEECRKLLLKIDENMKQVYIDRSKGKLDEETLEDWFNQGDTWLTAQEALDYGLCDEITGAIQLSAKFDKDVLKNYKNVPESLAKSLLDVPQNDNKAKKEPQEIEDEIKALIARVNTKTKSWEI